MMNKANRLNNLVLVLFACLILMPLKGVAGNIIDTADYE